MRAASLFSCGCAHRGLQLASCSPWAAPRPPKSPLSWCKVGRMRKSVYATKQPYTTHHPTPRCAHMRAQTHPSQFACTHRPTLPPTPTQRVFNCLGQHSTLPLRAPSFLQQKCLDKNAPTLIAPTHRHHPLHPRRSLQSAHSLPALPALATTLTPLTALSCTRHTHCTQPN